MSDTYRPTLPRPAKEYNELDQQNNRREIQRALDAKLGRNEFDEYVKNAGGGGGVVGAAMLDEDNIFTKANTFKGPVTVEATDANADFYLESKNSGTGLGTGKRYLMNSGAEGSYNIYDATDGRNLISIYPDGTIYLHQYTNVNSSIGIAGRATIGGDIILTQLGAGYVARPNVAGQKELRFAVDGGGPLDKFQVNALLTEITSQITTGFTAPDDDNDVTVPNTYWVNRNKGITQPIYIDQDAWTITADCVGRLVVFKRTVQVTMPDNIAWPPGTRIDFAQWDPGNSFFVAGGTAYIVSRLGKTLAGMGAAATLQLIYPYTNWILIGDVINPALATDDVPVQQPDFDPEVNPL